MPTVVRPGTRFTLKRLRRTSTLLLTAGLLALTGVFAASIHLNEHWLISDNKPTKPIALRRALQPQPAVSRPEVPASTESVDRYVVAGGGGVSTGGSFRLEATAGEAGAADTQSGGNFRLNSGFWNTLMLSEASPTPTPTPTATPTPTPSATPTPTPTPSPTPTPDPTPSGLIELLLDSSGPDPEQAAALDSVLFLRDPFPVINEFNYFTQPSDRNTRVALFAANLSLPQNESPAHVTVHLTAANGFIYDIPAEEVRTVPNFPFAQVVFRLPDNLAPGRCTVRIELHSQLSNAATFRVRP